VKTWHKAVCDQHREMCDIFVNNVECTSAYLGDRSAFIERWLREHGSCALRLIHDDVDLDEAFGAGCKSVLPRAVDLDVTDDKDGSPDSISRTVALLRSNGFDVVQACDCGFNNQRGEPKWRAPLDRGAVKIRVWAVSALLAEVERLASLLRVHRVHIGRAGESGVWIQAVYDPCNGSVAHIDVTRIHDDLLGERE